MRFLVNQGLDPVTTDGAFQGISAHPLDEMVAPRAFSGDFRICFDAWMNVIGPFPGGGSGSTQMASFGWGTNGGNTQGAGSTQVFSLPPPAMAEFRKTTGCIVAPVEHRCFQALGFMRLEQWTQSPVLQTILKTMRIPIMPR